MKTKKLILGLGIALLGNFAAHAQVGMQGIIVEKYYKANAADAAIATDPVPAGAVTYRVYADLAAGYKVQALYGEVVGAQTHNLKIQTTTSFYNNLDHGGTTPNGFSAANLKNNTLGLDSWFSMGAAGSGAFGIQKTLDDHVANLLLPHVPAGVLTNTTPATGIALTADDGMVAGAPEAVTFVGLSGLEEVFGTTGGNSFVTSNGSVASLNGSIGPDASNIVLIGQFTTTGVFTFELNLQVGDGTNTEKYVANTPQAGEFTMASLTGSFGTPPTITITTNPVTTSNFFVGNAVTIATSVADADGSVVSVQFFDGATSIGTDATSPFSYTYTPTGTGGHTITAKATDNDGNVTTSVASSLTAVANALPATAITSPAAAAIIVGGVTTGTVTANTTVTITATATDTDGPIDSVAFYVNGVRKGAIAGVGPYAFNWVSNGIYGAQSLTAKAYDQQGGSTTSAAIAITISNPNAKPYFVKNIDTTCIATSFCLPIRAKDAVTNVIGFDMVLTYDKSRVTPSGVISAGTLVNPSFVTTANTIDAVNGKMIISVSLNNAAPINTFFNGIGELICVGFNKTANFVTKDTAAFSISNFVESYYDTVKNNVVDPGKYITHRDSTVHASLQFWADNSAINSVIPTKVYTNNATCSGKSATFVSPNLAGQLTFTVSNTNVINGLTLNIDRDIAGDVSLVGATSVQPVVNGFDALLARKVVVSDLSFIPSVFQIIAMDVNMDGKISAGDVSQMNQRSVLSIGEFKQAWNYNSNGTKKAGKGKSRDWLFIDGNTLNSNGAFMVSSIYPSTDGVGFSKDKSPILDSCIATAITNAASCPLIGTEVYTGILLGDVNGNFKSIAAGAGLRSGSEDKIVFDLSKAISADGFVTIPVSIVSDKTINALDFSMQFDGGLVYNSIVNHASYCEGLGNFNITDTTLRFTSYSLQNFDINQPIVSVRVAANQVNNNDLKSLAGYLNGDQVNVEVIGNGGTSSVVENNLVTVYPNPASETVNVIVSENATVQLIDMEGSVVVSLNVYANQKQVISTENLANGVYTLKVANANFIDVKKVVIAK
jgi:Secretion system C-terminal sorting domain/Bacterial Ig domain